MRILTIAALVAALTAGSASAGPGKPGIFEGGGFLDKGNVVGAAKIIGGSFAAWTIYRFFQNCGPFTCNRS